MHMLHNEIISVFKSEEKQTPSCPCFCSRLCSMISLKTAAPRLGEHISSCASIQGEGNEHGFDCKPPWVTLYIKHLPEQHQIWTWESPSSADKLFSGLWHVQHWALEHTKSLERVCVCCVLTAPPHLDSTEPCFECKKEQQVEINWSESLEQAAL